MEDSTHDCAARRPTPASPISSNAKADSHWLGVTTLVPREVVPLAVEPEHAQTVRNGFELGHGGDLQSRMCLECWGERSFHPDVHSCLHGPLTQL
jgi:hypothetical protein